MYKIGQSGSVCNIQRMLYFNLDHLDFLVIFRHSINYRRVGALGQRKTKLRCLSESRHLHVQTKLAYYSAFDCGRWCGDNLVCNGTLRACRLQPHVPPCSCLSNITQSLTDIGGSMQCGVCQRKHL
jgi:hypothetical protein